MTKFLKLSLVILFVAILTNQVARADVLAGPVAADLYKNGNIASGEGDFTGSELFGGSGGARVGAGAGTMSTPQLNSNSPLVMKDFTATESTTDLTLATCTENPAGGAAEEMDLPYQEWSYNPNDRPEAVYGDAPATLASYTPPYSPGNRNFPPGTPEPPDEPQPPPVPPEPPVTPEPATALILFGGCVGLAATLRRRTRKSGATEVASE
ncbi:MAG: PEP-CTERM sorting domain-containing protein [Planctomycetaceae bacterium]|jgi:hypothetical protein|nr:PEP-CTERM sorting domain-containing protein [Planctomycetaceae bacterium]